MSAPRMQNARNRAVRIRHRASGPGVPRAVGGRSLVQADGAGR